MVKPVEIKMEVPDRNIMTWDVSQGRFLNTAEMIYRREQIEEWNKITRRDAKRKCEAEKKVVLKTYKSTINSNLQGTI